MVLELVRDLPLTIAKKLSIRTNPYWAGLIVNNSAKVRFRHTFSDVET